VKGLTTFLKENRSISRSLNLDTASGSTKDSIPIVIDAWGYVSHYLLPSLFSPGLLLWLKRDKEEELIFRLIFRLYHGSLPWTAGGEYIAFYRLIRRLLSAWKGVGLDMVFVFDGT